VTYKNVWNKEAPIMPTSHRMKKGIIEEIAFLYSMNIDIPFE